MRRVATGIACDVKSQPKHHPLWRPGLDGSPRLNNNGALPMQIGYCMPQDDVQYRCGYVLHRNIFYLNLGIQDCMDVIRYGINQVSQRLGKLNMKFTLYTFLYLLISNHVPGNLRSAPGFQVINLSAATILKMVWKVSHVNFQVSLLNLLPFDKTKFSRQFTPDLASCSFSAKIDVNSTWYASKYRYREGYIISTMAAQKRNSEGRNTYNVKLSYQIHWPTRAFYSRWNFLWLNVTRFLPDVWYGPYLCRHTTVAVRKHLAVA